MICLLISALTALFLFATRSFRLSRRVRRVEKIADGGFLLAFSGLLARVAMADGVVTEDEVRTVEGFFSRMGLSRAERAMCVGNFLLVQREKGDVRDDARALATKLNHVACLFLYGLVWRVANADLTITEGEERTLKAVGEALGLSVEEQAHFRSDERPDLDRRALDDAGVPPALARLWTR